MQKRPCVPFCVGLIMLLWFLTMWPLFRPPDRSHPGPLLMVCPSSEESSWSPSQTSSSGRILRRCCWKGPTVLINPKVFKVLSSEILYPQYREQVEGGQHRKERERGPRALLGSPPAPESTVSRLSNRCRLKSSLHKWGEQDRERKKPQLPRASPTGISGNRFYLLQKYLRVLFVCTHMNYSRT